MPAPRREAGRPRLREGREGPGGTARVLGPAQGPGRPPLAGAGRPGTGAGPSGGGTRRDRAAPRRPLPTGPSAHGLPSLPATLHGALRPAAAVPARAPPGLPPARPLPSLGPVLLPPPFPGPWSGGRPLGGHTMGSEVGRGGLSGTAGRRQPQSVSRTRPVDPSPPTHPVAPSAHSPEEAEPPGQPGLSCPGRPGSPRPPRPSSPRWAAVTRRSARAQHAGPALGRPRGARRPLPTGAPAPPQRSLQQRALLPGPGSPRDPHRRRGCAGPHGRAGPERGSAHSRSG